VYNFFITEFFESAVVENNAELRRSIRPTKGTGGAIEQLQRASEAVTEKQTRKSDKHKNIPDSTAVNPMAPNMNKSRKRRVPEVSSHLSCTAYE
jgi:hypothetical protein